MAAEVTPAPESGNGRVIETSETPELVRVVFLSEARTSPEPLWFHLAATGLAGRPASFVWQNADGCLGNSAHLERIRPVARGDGGEWLRLEALEVEDRADGLRVPSFRWPGGSDEVAVAFCYPYGMRELEETLAAAGGMWTREVIGASGHGRPYERLRLVGVDGGGRSARGGASPAGAYVVARNHAGETPGSWALDGMLRFLASDEPEAARLRESIDWWVVPFIDLDGALEGDYGKDAAPYDFNRSWLRMPMRPEVLSVQRDMMRMKRLTRRRLVLDLHAPGHAEDGIYVFMPREARPVAHRESTGRFAERLAARMRELPGPSFGSVGDGNGGKLSRECRYASRYNTHGSTAVWAWDNVDAVASATIETSYQSLGGEALDIEGYRRLGRQYALAVGDVLGD